jgi:hypothetical protein
MTDQLTNTLSLDEREQVFRRATSALPRWYAEKINRGMTDEELREALSKVLGIFGGSGGRDSLSVSYQGAGLKIWGSRGTHNHCTTEPLFQGAMTVAMARHIYMIADPADQQLGLF